MLLLFWLNPDWYRGHYWKPTEIKTVYTWSYLVLIPTSSKVILWWLRCLWYNSFHFCLYLKLSITNFLICLYSSFKLNDKCHTPCLVITSTNTSILIRIKAYLAQQRGIGFRGQSRNGFFPVHRESCSVPYFYLLCCCTISFAQTIMVLRAFSHLCLELILKLL